MTIMSALFIDKLSMTYDFNEDDGAGVTSLVRQYQQDGAYRIHYLGSNYQNRGYKNNWHLIVSGTPDACILLQTKPTRYIAGAYFRIEWNPQKLGREGNEQVWDFMRHILFEEFNSFIASAKVTRIDLAVDVTPMSPEALWFAAKGIHIGRMHGDVRTGYRGEIEYYRLGSRGSRLHFHIYNRNRDDNERVGPNTTRIEARVAHDCRLSELQTISNPFLRLTIAGAIDPVGLINVPDRYRMFLDSIRLRGLQGAVALLKRNETKNKFRRWIEENSGSSGEFVGKKPVIG